MQLSSTLYGESGMSETGLGHEAGERRPDGPGEVDVVGVGNAMVDIIGTVADDIVVSEGLAKGAMHLIDEERADYLYQMMQKMTAENDPALELVEASGGSAANTMAGIASFGGTSAYIGKVRQDHLGDVFARDMNSLGVAFSVPQAAAGPATARCLIMVTPDAQRTLNTYLGVSTLLEPDDVDPAVASAGQILFCEGYLWDTDSAKAAIRKAMDLAAGAGRRVSLTLSDPFCVERHHQDFLELVSGPVDILFANEAELTALFESDLDEAVEKVRAHVGLTCVTRGPKGSWLVTATDVVEVEAEEIAPVIDTTGAGDQYAAGILYGLSRNLPLPVVGRLGSFAAAEVISHMGPRPERPLTDFLAEAGA